MVKCSICGKEEICRYVEAESLKGASSRDISEGVKAKFDLDISHTSIISHLKDHMTEDSKDLISRLFDAEKRLKTVETMMMQHVRNADNVLFYITETRGGMTNERKVREKDIWGDMLDVSEEGETELKKRRDETLRTYRERHFGGSEI